MVGEMFPAFILLLSLQAVLALPKLPVFDYEISDPNQLRRIFKRADYGGVGGPLAAAELPETISGKFGPKPDVPRIAGQCRAAYDQNSCFYNMKAHQVLKINGTSAKPIATVECVDGVDCLKECIKKKCNYFLRSNLPSTKFLAHLYQLDDKILHSKEFVYSPSFDSAVQICHPGKRPGGQHRTKRQDAGSDDYYDYWWECYDDYYYEEEARKKRDVQFELPMNQNRKARRRQKRQDDDYWWDWDWDDFCFYGYTIAGALQATNAALAANQVMPPTPVIDPCGLADLFAEFDRHYYKNYNTEAEQATRSQNFCDNVKRMDELNKSDLTNRNPDDAKCGITNFADITTQGFVDSFTGAQENTGAEKCDLTDSEAEKLRHQRGGTGANDKHDWRDYGVVPPIRYQGQCGSCYAFATSDLVSIQNAVQNRISYGMKADSETVRVETLSSQYMMDCSPKQDAMGCKGGRPLNVLRSLIEDQTLGGIPLASCYGYTGKSAKCRETVCCERSKVTNARMLDIRGKNEKDAMAALLQNGPVLSVVDANEFWQFHNGSGVLKGHQCSKDRQNHAILVVGYDYSGSSPYYIIRNSWNNDWGKQGYAKLEAGNDACSIAKTVITTCARNCDHFTKDPKTILFKSAGKT